MIFLKVKNSYNKKLVTWLDLNLQVAQVYNFSSFILKVDFYSNYKHNFYIFLFLYILILKI